MNQCGSQMDAQKNSNMSNKKRYVISFTDETGFFFNLAFFVYLPLASREKRSLGANRRELVNVDVSARVMNTTAVRQHLLLEAKVTESTHQTLQIKNSSNL